MNKRIWPILFLAFASRIFALLLLNRYRQLELWEYDAIALNLLKKKQYVIHYLNTDYYSFGYPIYSILSATMHFLTNRNYFILEIFQIILSVLTCYYIYLIAKKIFNETVGLLSALLVTLHPGLIIYSTKIHELTLVVFFMALTFLLMISLKRVKLYNNILVGIIIGIGTLTRPTIIFFLPLCLLYFYLSSKSFKKSFRLFFIICVTACLVILPWILRNYTIHKRWVFITSNSGEHFWRGNNPNASGTALSADKRSMLDLAQKDFVQKLYKMKEMEQYDAFYGVTFKFIKSNFNSFIKMVFKKFFYFWWFSPQTGLNYPKLWFIIYEIYYCLLIPFFIVGCYFGTTKSTHIDNAAVFSFLFLFMLVSFLHSLYYVETRHRWSIEPFLLVVASYGMQSLFRTKE